LIWVDTVTHARYYDHKTSYFHKFIAKDHDLYIYIYIYIYVIEFQNHGNEHDQGLLRINNAPMDECIQMKKNWTICRHVYFL